MKTKIGYILVLLITTTITFAQNNKNSSGEFISKCPDKLFLGAILEAKSLNDNDYKFLKTPDINLRVSYDNPMPSHDYSPSYENMMKSIEKLISDGHLGKQSTSFSYLPKKFSKYEEIEMFFGQNIDISTYFGIPKDHKPKKTIMGLIMSQTFFSVAMDMPDDGVYSKDKEIRERAEELIYVDQISFGRVLNIIIESDLPYAKLSKALNEITKNWDTPGKISEESRATIANSSVHILQIGEEMPDIDPDNPILSALELFRKEVNKEYFGKPISFTASELKTNAVFTNEY